jgi:hypothetical protein
MLFLSLGRVAMNAPRHWALHEGYLSLTAILLSNTAFFCYPGGVVSCICVYENYFPNSKQLNKAALEKLKGLSQDGGRALPPSIKTHRITIVIQMDEI